MLHFCKLISNFYSNHAKKLIAISSPINSISPMTRLTIKPIVKPKVEVLTKKNVLNLPK